MGTRVSVLVAVMLVLFVPAARGESRTVALRGTAFDRSQIEISPGDTVVWKHESGNARHTVTFDDGSFDSHPACPALLVERCLRDGETVQRQFNQPGTFTYHCKIHKASGMVGTITVVGPAGPTPTSPPGGTPPGGTATTRPSSSPTTEATAPPTTQTSRPPPSTKPTVIRSTTTTTGPVTTPADKSEPPAFDPDSPEEVTEVAKTEPGSAGAAGGGDGGSGPVALIAGMLVAVAAGGAFLLWRLRPVRRPA